MLIEQQYKCATQRLHDSIPNAGSINLTFAVLKPLWKKQILLITSEFLRRVDMAAQVVSIF
jgi:hypothetical protein